MKLLFVYIIIIISLLPVYSQNIWEETYNSKFRAVKIGVVDSNNIYIGSSQGLPTYLYKSTNQGKSWNKTFEGNKTGIESLQDLSVIDNDNLYLSFSKGHLMRSSDGGVNFEQVYLDSTILRIQDITMYDNDIGVVEGGRYITKDGWKTYEEFYLKSYLNRASTFINDSILYSIVYDITANSSFNYFLLNININSKEFTLNKIDSIYSGISDLSIVNENLIFVCGKSNTISGGSGHDAIYKSTNGGKNWRSVLDLYSEAYKFPKYLPPFGLQQIAFKDSLTGIAVGQFGKIIYTYDGGKSWQYEKELHPSIKSPPTMIVRYAGNIPILADYLGYFYRMVEDNLTPDPEDTLCISGRVWLDGNGQPGVSIFLNDYRVTMTDSSGYYKFRRLKQGSYKVQAKNKYIDNPQFTYFYKPFDYTPTQYEIDLSHDTSGFDFNAIDLRTYHTISGYVLDKDGKGLANIVVRFAPSTTTADGLGLADTTTTTDVTGKFEFAGVESYKYWDITPFNDTLKFSPLKRTIRLISGDTTGLVFTATPTTSVWESTDNSEILIKPNPAEDFIEITVSNRGLKPFAASYNVQIFDLLGIEVISESIHPMNASHRMNIENLPAGVYFIRIGDKVEKFIKSY
ncbi:MAG: T9SS type A sorting domain-containing protein [Candidatus Kapabacteria bacterium]|nr:T9SS type A sorting domain-containing protein [Candidatus Kapabacteria bacterium]